MGWPFASINKLLYYTVGPADFRSALPWAFLYAFSAIASLTVWSLGGPIWGGPAANAGFGIVFFLVHGFFFYVRGLSGSLVDLAPTVRRYPRAGDSPSPDGAPDWRIHSSVTPSEVASTPAVSHHHLLPMDDALKDQRAVTLPAIACPVCFFVAALAAGLYNNALFLQASCVGGCSGYGDTMIAVINGSLILPIQLFVLLAAAHLAALKALCVLHERRLVHLHDLLRDRNMGVIGDEVAAYAPLQARTLLARPPSSAPPAANASRWRSLCAWRDNSALVSVVVLNPLAPLDASLATPDMLAGAHDIDKFICLYNAVRLELATHAKRWQVPALLYAAAALLIFASLAQGSVRSLINGTMPPFDIWFVGLLGMLLLLVLNMMPAVSLNSCWSRLIETHCTDLAAAALWAKWQPSERLVLSSYFLANPLVFPIGGITFTWGRVQAMVITALSPTIVAAITKLTKST
jgi:hypothetical protein